MARKKYIKSMAVLLSTVILMCGCSGVRVDTEEIGEIAGKESLERVRGSFDYTEEELYADREGNDIYGVVYIPEGLETPAPTVIYSHGLGGSHQYGSQYAEALASKGYVVYCFDFCGGSPGSRSDGSPLDMSVFTEQKDLEAVIDLMQEQDYVDQENLFLLGTSQGGAVSAITAAEHPDEIRGLILLYPAFLVGDWARKLFEDKEDIPDTYYHMWMDVGRDYFEDVWDYDIYEEIGKYEKEVLILHGDEDNIVPISYSERALEVYPSVRLEIMEGAGHGFSGEDAEKAVNAMVRYLEEHYEA